MAALTRKSSRAGDVKVSKANSRPELKKSASIKAGEQRSIQAKRASILLKHVSDPTRFQVILILAEGEQHVGALCSQLSQSQPAVSHHLALLRHAGFIAPRRQGKNNFYSLTDTGTDLGNVLKGLMSDGRKADRPRQGPANPPPVRSPRPASRDRVDPLDAHTPRSDRRDSYEEEPWSVMNRRRAELIFKKNRDGLDDAERLELEGLQSISRARMHREFQSPSLIDEKLKEIEEILRGGGVGEK
jgi:DNA-binding transcriptional ArsR family regulator